jgi:thiol-disulfide isomerase/thioredoxin
MFTRVTAVVTIFLLMAGCRPGDEPETISPPQVADALPGEETQPEPSPSEQPDAAKEPEPTPSPEELITQAQDAATSRDYELAINLGEQALTSLPDDADLLFLLGYCSERQASQLAQTDQAAANPLLLKGADYMRRFREVAGATDPRLRAVAMVLYSAACAHALEGNQEETLATLGEAFDAGFEELSAVETNPDLATLRDNPAFKSLIEETRAKLMERFREESRQMIAEFEPFDFSFALPDTKGNTISLADFQGKVVIVDIWGTWCPPCRREIPHFVALYDKYRKDGLEMVGINYERVEESEWIDTIESFVAENGVTYPCLIGDEATQEMVPDFRGFPTTLFIDRSGTVRAKKVGSATAERLEAIVLELLGAATP